MKNRKKFIVANWKMNGSLALCSKYVSAFSNFKSDLEVVVAPSFIYAAVLLSQLEGDLPFVAGQDCHFAASGAHTGNVSAAMLSDVGCKYVMVGHSERRLGHGETSDLVCKKAKAAIDARLIPIICVGDSNEERKEQELTDQCKRSIPVGGGDFVIAYEPIYSIGTGLIPTSKQIDSAVKIIKMATRADVPVIYGGSVTSQNCCGIMQISVISGLLVGGASLNIEHFLEICKNVGNN